MHVEDIAYEVDGETMVGTLYVDDPGRGPRPSVLVCHAGTGLAPFHRERAQRIASLGCCTFALDVFGGGRVYPRGGPRADHAALRARAQAGYDILVGRPECDPARVAAVGFCFGGALMIELGRMGADLKAFVGFHPGLALETTGENPNITAPVLMCIGTADPFVPNDLRVQWERQMRDAGVDLRVELYEGVGHVFTDPDVDAQRIPGCAYDRTSDERSWAAMQALLRETIGV